MAKLCKVCGLTRTEDAKLCDTLGVDFTGFIFVPGSPRLVTPDFVASVPYGQSRRVGIFAGASVEEMQDCAERAGLDYFQLHGGEGPEICARLGQERVIKVLWPEKLTLDELQKEIERFAPVCTCFLLDAGKSGGGSGTCLPFSALVALDPPRPWLLAGGLGPDTLDTALSVCSPSGVDLNSALEDAPGIKNHQLLRQAVNIVKSLIRL